MPATVFKLVKSYRPRCLAALVATLAVVAVARGAAPTAEEALKLEPRQKGAEFDRPGPDDVRAATIKQEKFDGVDALVVRGPDGRIFLETFSPIYKQVCVCVCAWCVGW